MLKNPNVMRLRVYFASGKLKLSNTFQEFSAKGTINTLLGLRTPRKIFVCRIPPLMEQQVDSCCVVAIDIALISLLYIRYCSF